MRECEGEGARVRQRGRNLVLSRSRASRFLKPVNFSHVCSFHKKTFYIKRRGPRSRVAPTEHHSLVLLVTCVKKGVGVPSHNYIHPRHLPGDSFVHRKSRVSQSDDFVDPLTLKVRDLRPYWRHFIIKLQTTCWIKRIYYFKTWML